MSELTDKQIKFCEEYLIDLNATQAAIRAGYSEKTARSIANENLTKPDIQNYLTERQKELKEETGITQKRVLQELSAIAFSDIRRFYDENGNLKSITELDDEAAAALAGVETEELFAGFGDDRAQIGMTKKIKRWDKGKALETLGRHLGIFGKDNEQSKPVVHINGMKIT
jgi:phage terminase small subunit